MDCSRGQLSSPSPVGRASLSHYHASLGFEAASVCPAASPDRWEGREKKNKKIQANTRREGGREKERAGLRGKSKFKTKLKERLALERSPETIISQVEPEWIHILCQISAKFRGKIICLWSNSMICRTF